MAYVHATNPLVLASEIGLYGSTDGRARGVYYWQSTNNSTDFLTAGYFSGVGQGSRGGNDLGVRVGDLLVHRASTSSTAVAGRVTWHSFVNSTANVSGSTILSSNYSASFDMTVASAT